MQLVGVGGYAFAGKDAFVDGLVELCGYGRTFMSKPLLDALLVLDPLVILRDIENSQKTNTFLNDIVPFSLLHEAVGYEAAKREPEVRRLLQVLGTEIGRKMFGEDVWVNLVIDDAYDIANQTGAEYVAVTGIRFKNELNAFIKERGFTVWIDRPGVGPVNDHVSDNSLGKADFDHCVLNHQGLEDLRYAAQHYHQSMFGTE